MIEWNKPTHGGTAWIAEVPELGRFYIHRRMKYSKQFMLTINGKATKHYGTIEELKNIAYRIMNGEESNGW